MARVVGTQRENQFVTQLTMRLKWQGKKDINPSLADFKPVPFTESHSSRLDGTKLSAHTMTISQMKIIHTCTPQMNIKLETSWVLQLNSHGPNGPVKRREDYANTVP